MQAGMPKLRGDDMAKQVATTQRAYTLRLWGADPQDQSWREAPKPRGDGVFKDREVLLRPPAGKEFRESGNGDVSRRACAQHHDRNRNARVIFGQLKLRRKGRSLLKIYLCNKAGEMAKLSIRLSNA